MALQHGKNLLPIQIRVATSPDDPKFESLLGRIESLTISTLATTQKSAPTLSCEIVRIQDHRQGTDVFLPVSCTPCLLVREGRSYISSRELETKDVEQISEFMEANATTGDQTRVLKEIIPACETTGHFQSTADFVVYVPHSRYHIRGFISTWRPSFESETTRFNYMKDGSPLWSVHICHQVPSCVYLEVAPATLHTQFKRMQSDQQHGFTLLVRDFIRNACAVAQQLSGEQLGTRKLFYPGIFDIAADARSHYDAKVARFTTQEESEAGPIRKYNNFVKSYIISEFVPPKCVILDLACGHGQDINKYKSKSPKLYLGTDISQAALTEAEKRHRSGRLNYSAHFVQGNLMLPDIFEEIQRIIQSQGFTEDAVFDAVSMQLALHYVIETQNHADEFFGRVSKLIKPGGRFIATFPCCERIANRMRNISIQEDKLDEFGFGNDMYRVTFSSEEVCKVVPDLKESILTKSVEQAEAVLNEIDSEEILQTVSTTWGVKYKFWLVETIENQEEYVVPLRSLESSLGKFGMHLEFGGNFAEVIDRATRKEPSVFSDFLKKNKNVILSDAEDDVFRFYRAVVFKKE